MTTFPFSHRPFPAVAVMGLIIALFGGRLYAQASPSNPASAAVPADPAAHAAHAAAGSHPAATPVPAAAEGAKSDPALAELRAKVAQLEAALMKNAPPVASAPADGAMPGVPPGVAPPANPAMSTGTGTGQMNASGQMSGAAGPAASPAMAGMGDPSAPASGGMNMMGMMDKMMGMMDKMMGMEGGAMPMGGAQMAPAAPGGMGKGMDMDRMKMGGTGMDRMKMGGTGMMAMDKMEMAGMMGMPPMGGGAPGAMPQSALPGFPGASHLYHLGATDFFLDHKAHIALTTGQTAALNQAKEKAALTKSTADRAIAQAGQELWTLTASDQPEIAAIEAKTAEIGKLTADARVAFIRAVGEASQLLTGEQRKSLTGFAPPAPAAPMAAPAAMAPMKDM